MGQRCWRKGPMGFGGYGVRVGGPGQGRVRGRADCGAGARRGAGPNHVRGGGAVVGGRADGMPRQAQRGPAVDALGPWDCGCGCRSNFGNRAVCRSCGAAASGARLSKLRAALVEDGRRNSPPGGHCPTGRGGNGNSRSNQRSGAPLGAEPASGPRTSWADKVKGAAQDQQAAKEDGEQNALRKQLAEARQQLQALQRRSRNQANGDLASEPPIGAGVARAPRPQAQAH